MTAPTDRPHVPDVLPLVHAIYARPGGGVGCCLHILTDDGNCEQDHADHVLALAREREHPDCIQAAELLVRMSHTGRRKVYGRAYEKPRAYEAIAREIARTTMLCYDDAMQGLLLMFARGTTVKQAETATRLGLAYLLADVIDRDVFGLGDKAPGR